MTSQKNMVEMFPSENLLSVHPRPYVNHAVEFKRPCTRAERFEMLERVGFNVFSFPSELVAGCDFLSDSGTTAMTNEQWAAMHLGDEAYGSNRGYFQLLEEISKTFGADYFYDAYAKGAPHAFLFHQGRAVENVLFACLSTLGEKMVIPSNGHFDTTHANIEAHGIQTVNFFSEELKNKTSSFPFKGNMNLPNFENFLKQERGRIPVVFLTITNNTGGGQPVSMENIRAVSTLTREAGLPLLFDACRFAENAWFIQRYEKGFSQKTISDIVHEMFSHVDGFTISFKKDGLGNMGGGIFLRRNGFFIKKYPQLLDQLMNIQVLKEGHPSYGGLTGRDIMALAVGLRTVTTGSYLTHRITQVQQFGELLQKSSLPVLTPIGGHAVYLDMNVFFDGVSRKPEDFGGIAFTGLLLGAYGHRACELGNFAFGKFDSKTGKHSFPEVNFVRFAIPRLRYEAQDLASAAEAVKILYEHRDQFPKVEVSYGLDLPLRHFKARFKFV